MNLDNSTNLIVTELLQGKIAALSRAITLSESTLTTHQEQASAILDAVLDKTGKSFRLGITGSPGVGKSTFIETFGLTLLSKGKRIAVLAIDPSSTISKGSILGDKTRMNVLSSSPNVFIRPSPSSGTLGGVGRNTRDAVLLCEAAGFDFIIIETVGVGQSETEVYQLSDFFMLLMLPGSGDELQGIKRGIMEMADAVVITKSDGENRQKANRAKAEFNNALHLFGSKENEWVCPVHSCSATENSGIEEIVEMLDSYKNSMTLKGYIAKKRSFQNLFWFERTLKEMIVSSFFAQKEKKEIYEKVKFGIIHKEYDIRHALKMILGQL